MCSCCNQCVDYVLLMIVAVVCLQQFHDRGSGVPTAVSAAVLLLRQLATVAT
jgi:membrane-bound ClpP family serine protease